MSLLSSGDLSKILSAVELLNSDTNPKTLPERSLSCVLSLIPSEMTAFDGFDLDSEYTGYYWYSPPGTVSEERVKVLGELVHEHPIFETVLSPLREMSFRTSDYMPLKKFHRTPLYNEFYRCFGGETQMGTSMKISPKSFVTCTVHRPSVDFSDAEYESLRLIAPHLKAAFRNAQAIGQLKKEKKYMSAAVTKGLIVLDGEGKIVFQTELAEALIGKYFRDLEPNGLPPSLNLYLREIAAAVDGEEYYRPPEPIRFVESNGELKIDVVFDARQRELTLVFEEKVGNSPSDYAGQGLTPRESEVLYWISRGKTNPEIAVLCEISPRTVHKHVENILSKFGVETRTAAVLHANGKIG